MIMKQNMNRKMSWSALGMVVLVAVMVLPIVARTIETQDSAKDVQPQDTAPVTDAGAATDTSAAKDPRATAGTAQAGKPSDASGQTPSTQAILKRISRLEQLLQDLADQHRGTATGRRVTDGEAGELPNTAQRTTGRRVRGGGSVAASAASSPLPTFDVSPDKHEQELQEQLLKLDVDAARADGQHAQSELNLILEANRNTPRSVSQVEIQKQRAALDVKKVQLQRAETLLELFKKQVQRKREEVARRNVPPTSAGDRNRQLHEARLRAERTDQLARLKELNQRAADKVRELEQRLKVSPDSPETWQAVEEFLELWEQETKSEAEPSRATYGGRR